MDNQPVPEQNENPSVPTYNQPQVSPGSFQPVTPAPRGYQPEQIQPQITQQPVVAQPITPQAYPPAQPSQELAQPAPAVAPTASTPLQQNYGMPQPGMPTPLPQQVYQQPTQSPTGKDPGHGLGIASLVTSLIGLTPVGIILGILGMSKSKKAGFGTNVMALIGLIIGAVGIASQIVLVGLVLNNFQGAQGKARDVSAVTDMNAVHSKLEEYYNENARYPKEISAVIFPGIDPQALVNTQGVSIVSYNQNIKTIAEASLVENPTSSEPYQYIAFDCDNTGCAGYLLRSYIEKPTVTTPNPYVKRGLQNP